MIKSLSIQGFQSHLDTTMEFSPGVNVIVGTSDSGKSAIFRSLQWAATNKPGGTAFLNWKTTEAHVTVETDDKHRIERKRGKSNLYLLDGKKNEAFRTDVPPDIVEALNLSDVNWQAQHDGPFLVGETSGQVAKTLNGITNLGIIHDSLGRIASTKRETNSEIRILEEQFAEREQQLDSLDGVHELEEALSDLEFLEQHIERAQKGIEMAESLLALMAELAELEHYLQAGSLLQECETLQHEIQVTQKQYDSLVALDAELQEHKAKDFSWIPKAKEALSGATYSQEGADLLSEKLKALDGMWNRMQEYEASLAAYETELACATDELEAFEVCPLCGKPMGE